MWLSQNSAWPNTAKLQTWIAFWISYVFLILVILGMVERCVAGSTIHVNTPSPGATRLCSLQEAIYSAEFGSNIALSQTDPDTTYTTTCEPGTGGGDTIILQSGTTYSFNKSWDGDAHNYMGPTATPIIFTNITIQGNGATLQWNDTGNSPAFRLFAVGSLPSSGPLAINVNGSTYSGTGSLTLQNVDVKNFHVKGGDGVCGGGGGLGAGGAIYVGDSGASLTIDNSTFENNGAVGGNAQDLQDASCVKSARGVLRGGGGGGGLHGNGGHARLNDPTQPVAEGGGGGGGARGNGGDSSLFGYGGGGGGGTVFDGADGDTGSGGYLCGGTGNSAQDGGNGTCLGGGGGGGGGATTAFGNGTNGGGGKYGGGGGGGGSGLDNTLHSGGNGGIGGFGGGGGAGALNLNDNSGDGGAGGFGGGGGAGATTANNGGVPGPYGGRGDAGAAGGGGGGLGGAIFNAGGSVTVRNSTFYNNYVTRGVAGCYPNCPTGTGADNGGDSGGAIFSVNGSLIVQNSTITANTAVATGAGGGMVFYTWDPCSGSFSACLGFHNSFAVQNTIIANTGAKECASLGKVGDNASLTVSGAGNLIMQNDADGPCPGVVTTSDPQLHALQVNLPGNTPTMAILPSSPAADAADTDTFLATDQRGVDRPQHGAPDIGAYEARPPDFTISDIPNISVDIGGSASGTVNVNSIDYFNAAVALVASYPSASLTATLNPTSVTPPSNGSASSSLGIKLAATTTAGTYDVTIQGSSSSFTHLVGALVIVTATPKGMMNVINSFLTTGAIDKSGIASALTSKLSVAQTFITAGDNQTATNVLQALLNQLNAQSGKHINASSASALITDTQALQAGLGNLTPNPLLGFVVNSSSGIGGATVSVLNASNSVVATAITDSTGFYFFPLTRTFSLGSGYTVKVTLPKGYKSSSPASQKFSWQGSQIILSNSLLN
jgi:hypothetical protein